MVHMFIQQKAWTPTSQVPRQTQSPIAIIFKQNSSP